ncbi:hypothetical protein B7P43_G12800 [Cryptotermes secundus]|uniref:CAP-Gly domain-containing protein n=2 Tax=Cryptotermes secundus TaxID=105785 RepID=A0A2J7QGP0_9NEOP|nr:uncharacterized protein LOC111867656 isoform X3 [Cryptotermes secundus]XP_023713453.1 uncharacterized protein LOC111867656 isoform X3 [Cryptotermes secundus]XP_023713454.1 uncharacterized protein LOC111867656 isoform X3 [Cryptotermes secundus]XP_033608654.1 uncharacterized protein LOC111867656 isoform X3 [Cryptotermes secundus]XP_033608655.1 uncharacterized protein LOC111867656 isoform X3 [Cryptotermes secundus]PNF27761.1 hypothetical protein B7P43_G12800 [Cryptotermes secundus]PNF27762.1 
MDISKRGPLFAQLAPERWQNLETVRALHQTVVSLRAALDNTRAELQLLRDKVQNHVDSNVYIETIEKLSLENHILRQRVLNRDGAPEYIQQLEEVLAKGGLEAIEIDTKYMEPPKCEEVKDSQKVVNDTSVEEVETSVQPGEDHSEKEKGDSPEKSYHREPSMRSMSEEDQSLCSETSQHEVGTPQGSKTAGESDNDSEELDDIELIFTTEETKELGVLQEDLVSITDTDAWQPSETPVLLKFAETDQFDEATEDALEVDGKDKKPGDENDNDNDKVQSNLSKMWTQSVLVETDISKCGVVDETEIPGRTSRRNTMPNPLVYQPIIHREALAGSKSQLLGLAPASPRPLVVKFATSPAGQSHRNGKHEYRKSPMRPILVERNASKRESEAQTDITALPSHWKSESYLAHKVSHNFTTLPSKFALPMQQTAHSKYSLRLSDKTQEARRTLLSDINFTSMVPELSRSADHLSQEGVEPEGSDQGTNIASELCRNYPRAYSYMKNTETGHLTDNLVSPGYLHSREYGKDSWTHCSCAHNNLMHYGSMTNKAHIECYPSIPRYRGSLTSIPAHATYEYSDARKRHSWKPTSEMYRSCSMTQRPTWGSVPSSPTHNHHSRCIQFSPSYTTPHSDVNLYSSRYWAAVRDAQCSGLSGVKSTKLSTTKSRARNKVTFQVSSLQRPRHPGQSLPDLRSDFELDSGDSTDSLIDEAEEYLRRSIDSILTGTDWGRVGQRRQNRRFSEPDPVREFVPPRSAQPFLPKIPRDLKLDYFVKVITSEGRVMVGRVRYVGLVSGSAELHVGVELPQDTGDSDGVFQGHRYFDCDPDRAVFVPFKKVVMAWSI